MNSLRSFIKHHYGNTNRCAKELEITPQAVGQWFSQKPRNALRYMPEFIAKSRVTPEYFLRIVLNTEVELAAERAAQEVEQKEGVV